MIKKMPLEKGLFGLLVYLLCVLVSVGAPAADGKAGPLQRGGVVAVWLSERLDSEAILKMPVVKGGQVMVQWGEVEVAKDKYDFRAFDAKIAEYAKRKQPVTIQLNGNRKPSYLFNEVPYVKETGREVPAFKQVQNREGTLMYWHPTHEKAYLNVLTAFRDHLAHSPYKQFIIGLRMNFNPFGTEGINIYPREKAAEFALREKWIRPPGLDASIAYKGFDLQEGLNYVRRIMRKHIELFDGVVPLFIRCTVNSEVLAEFAPYLEKGTFGIFETGSGFAPFATKTEDEEEWILRYCKPGKTRGYAESIADCWGMRTGGRDQLLVSPPQANYWRVLCDLHKGVAYLAFYGNDLNVALTGNYQSGGRGGASEVHYSDRQSGFNYRKEFYEALEFADKYAGFHASPEETPGAWIALRGSTAVADGRNTREKLKVFNGDYTFLMERVPDKSEGVMKIGPDHLRYGAYSRRLPGQGLMQLKVNERYLQSLKGPCVLRVIYYDDTPGASFSISASDQNWRVALAGDKAWHSAEFEVAKPAFRANPAGAQIVIQNGDKPVCLHMIQVDRK